MKNIVEIIQQNLTTKGFDILELFSINTYNQNIEEDHKIPQINSENNLAFLVGNTKNFWPYFIKALKDNPNRLKSENPFDDFVVENIESLKTLTPDEIKIRYTHRPEPKHIAFQKLASLIGLAYLAPSHLCIHPKFGPWFSLRAVITLPITANLSKNSAVAPCQFCIDRCNPVFNLALSKNSEATLNSQAIKSNWQDWLAVRDSCPTGKEYRFSEEQIKYHYTKDKEILKKLVLFN
ncbi:MAG: hypothetical protein U0T83_04050 [Bacteriovoracaceae bacterium]